MNIYEKLSEIQNELKAPKSQHNAFGKYNYRNCEDILEAVKPLCKKNKAVLLLSDTIQNIADRYYVVAGAVLQDLESNESVTVTAYAREEETKKGMDGSQITGASSSYARKYALNGLFNIDDTKDSDATNKDDEPKSQPKQKSQRDQIVELIDECNFNANEVVEYTTKHFNTKDINKLTKDQFSQLVAEIKKAAGNG